MSAPLQTVASDIRSLSSHQRTISTTEFDMAHPIAAKSALIQGRRHALSDRVNHSFSGGALSEKTSSVDQGPSPTICSSADGTKLHPVEVHSATARTCLNVPRPEPVVPVPEDIPQVAGLNPGCGGCISSGGGNAVGPCAQIWAHNKEHQSPEEKAGDLSMEVMHNKLDCSDELCVLSEEPLAVADDAVEDSWLSSIAAPGMDRLGEELSSQLELEFVNLRCDAPEWLEPVPDVPVPAVELSVDELADSDEDLEIEAMHLYDDEEGFFDLPEEFKLEDKHFEVFRDLRGVRLHLRRSMAVVSPMPSVIPPPPVLDLGYMEDDFVDLEAIDKPVPQSVLQCVPLD
ncbi:uncharacterized protein LOC142761789 isoform X1 [Rhipicephalus microplus]|uniref:uncharacterized protein LOC142761789 isoform X1 n=1 Tax=Rhipicephalus microplus TaxID=6941 RepID=UPI003F6A67A3